MPWRVPLVGGSYRGSASKTPPHPPQTPPPPPGLARLARRCAQAFTILGAPYDRKTLNGPCLKGAAGTPKSYR